LPIKHGRRKFTGNSGQQHAYPNRKKYGTMYDTVSNTKTFSQKIFKKRYKINPPVEPIDRLKSAAIEFGFELAGVVQAGQPQTFNAFEHWLDAGYYAGMNHLAEKRNARKSPESLLRGVRSILMLGVSFATVLDSEKHPVQQLTGIAEYARGIDYHGWIRQRLKRLAVRHRELFPNGRCRGVVDTAPILEKQFAANAGLGWIGKNTLLINPKFGSKIFLAAFLSTEQWKTNSANSTGSENSGNSRDLENNCGDCRCCLDACPTQAFVEPFILDARRCLNYWTIEHRSGVPAEIRTKCGNRFFGCDTCQNVCPWNQSVSAIPEGTIDPQSLNIETLRTLAAGSPLQRIFRLPCHHEK
jgi:epoxyqueuosine reductase